MGWRPNTQLYWIEPEYYYRCAAKSIFRPGACSYKFVKFVAKVLACPRDYAASEITCSIASRVLAERPDGNVTVVASWVRTMVSPL